MTADMTMTEPMKDWTLMASHGVVLFFIAANPEATMREMADELGITERRIARIVKDLSEAGMITVERTGRRNIYTVNEEAHFRHPTLSHIRLGRFVNAINEDGDSKPADEKRSTPVVATMGLLASFEWLAQPLASVALLA